MLNSLAVFLALMMTDATEVTLALHPIIYNETTHANDGYGAYTYRLGDYDTTAKKRLNAATGEYVAES